MRFLVIIEDAGENLSAYAPDLPGCIATGATRKEVLERMREAIRLHLEGMREDGAAGPPSSTTASAYVTV